MHARLLVLLIAGLLSLFVAACGGGDEESGGGGGSSGSSGGTNLSEGSKKAPAADAAQQAKGNVTYCTGKDTSGAQKASVEEFNKQFKSQGLSAKLLEFPESADEQRNQFIQRQEAKSGECDIFYSDVRSEEHTS